MKDMTPDEAMKNRFKILNNIEPIPLSDGIDPPAERMKETWEIPCTIPSRNCIECGKMHNMCVTDRIKETHTPIEKCYDCFWKNAFIYRPPKEKINLNL